MGAIDLSGFIFLRWLEFFELEAFCDCGLGVVGILGIIGIIGMIGIIGDFKE